MRKFFSFLLVFGIFCSATACGGASGGIPDNMSEKMYEIGLAALEIADEYFDGGIDLETARKRIDASFTSADSQYKKDQEEVGDSLIGTKYSNDYFIHHELTMLSYELLAKSHGTGTNKDITSARNDLAKHLNEKSR